MGENNKGESAGIESKVALRKEGTVCHQLQRVRLTCKYIHVTQMSPIEYQLEVLGIENIEYLTTIMQLIQYRRQWLR